MVAAGVAMVATGVATVSGTVALVGPGRTQHALVASYSLADRGSVTSRSGFDRVAALPSLPSASTTPTPSPSVTTGEAKPSQPLPAQPAAAPPPPPPTNPKDLAKSLMPQFGLSASEFPCLVSLWNRESGWNLHASNPSGAYGIPQALPGSKMGSAGPDWQNNAQTQISWGLRYVKSRYGSACAADSFQSSNGYY